MNLFRRTWWLYGFLAVLAGPLVASEYTGRWSASAMATARDA